MAVNKMAYIVFYKGKSIEKQISRMPVNVKYISKKLNYLVFYGDQNKEKTYFNHLKNVQGFQKLEASPLYSEDVNFNLLAEDNSIE